MTSGQGQRNQSILIWSHWHAALMLVTLLVQWLAGQPLLLLISIWLSITWYLLSQRAAYNALWHGIGRANALSLVRLFLLSLVLVFYSKWWPIISAVLLIICVVLDGFDGALARRYGESSSFGHYLDVEIDAFAIAVLCVLLWHYQSISGLILLAAAMRYAYVLLIKFSVREPRLEPSRRYASVIAVTVYVVMTIRLAFDQLVFSAALVIGCLLLVWSFSRSLWFQWRN